MKRLIKAREIRHLVFGSPSIQLGDKTISINEVTKAIYNNDEIKKILTKQQYHKICLEVPNAEVNYANYGCYGNKDNETFYAIEFYQFQTDDKKNDYLFIVIAKPFSCELCGGDTSDDVIISYNGEIESDYFFGSYTSLVSKNKITVNNKEIQLFKDIDINLEPEDFYIWYVNNKKQ